MSRIMLAVLAAMITFGTPALADGDVDIVAGLHEV
jgi:hypothetical protein